MMEERKLATVRTVSEVIKHPNADALDLITVDGWNVVAKLNEFSVGDKCVFFEIDSYLPADDERYAFMARNAKKLPSGEERIRLKTMKLRGELSQGLALPIDMFPEVEGLDEDSTGLDELLNIIKYERPEPKAANAAGNFPTFIPKTSEPRIQNIYNKMSNYHKEEEYYPTLKMDGSSCTVFALNRSASNLWSDNETPFDMLGPILDNNGEVTEEVMQVQIGLCSRNLRLKYDENSHFWKAAESSGVIYALQTAGYRGNIAIQGEVMGPGIQGNKEKFDDYKFFVFNIYDIDNGKYWSWDEVIAFCVEHHVVPVKQLAKPMKPFSDFSNLDDLLKFSDGESLYAKRREGIVWKAVDGNARVPSFKVISNQFLLRDN